MQISIGILAYNESLSIRAMLESLFEQTLWQEANPEFQVELIVVPNGCTDDTAFVARKTLAKLSQPLVKTNFNWQVCEVKQPGNSNAWNLYVHQFANPDADYLFLMDSDIKLLDRLRSAGIPQKVILAGSASHVFEAYTNISRLLRHEKWLILGSAITLGSAKSEQEEKN